MRLDSLRITIPTVKLLYALRLWTMKSGGAGSGVLDTLGSLEPLLVVSLRSPESAGDQTAPNLLEVKKPLTTWSSAPPPPDPLLPIGTPTPWIRP